jgi:hypothetical protein
MHDGIIDEYGADGIIIGGRNVSIRRKPTEVPLCPPQIPHYLNWDGTWDAVVEDGY